MNLLISALLSILAQTTAVEPSSRGLTERVWFAGSAASATVSLEDIKCENALFSSTPDLGEWLQIDFARDAQFPPPLPQLYLYLQQSSRLAGTPVSSDGDSIRWMMSSGVVLDIKLRHVIAIAGNNFVSSQLETDRLRLQTSSAVIDELDGFFLEMSEGKFKFETSSSVLEISYQKLLELRFMQEANTSEEFPAQVYLSDGSRLAAKPVAMDEEHLIFDALWQSGFQVELQSLSKITRISTAFLTFSQALQSTSIDHHDMRIANRSFSRGWPQTPQTEVVIKCSQDGLLSIWCGIDDEVAGFREPSPMTFLQSINGKLAQQSSVSTVGEQAKLLRLKVKAGDEIKLHTKALFDTLAGAHGAWCDPVFIPLY
ncbi:MAG: hypothetical protein ACI84O_000373 [Myxococcota bacterium]|jgi:hypothetical protein